MLRALFAGERGGVDHGRRAAMTGSGNGKPPSLDDLGARVRAARGAAERGSGRRPAGNGPPPGLAGMAMRAGIEVVAGVAVGAAAGYGLDLWLGASPWLLILGFALGSAAGMLNAWRAISNAGMALGYRPGDAGSGPSGDGRDGG